MSDGWVGFALGFFLGGLFGVALMAAASMSGMERER